MKQTVKTSRVAGQLEKMFRLLNNHFFNGELPEVVISLKKTVGAYGHFTCGKVWQAGDERRYEINISSATLNRPIEETCATLLHEMCHLACAVGYSSKVLDENGKPEPIKDTSNNDVYHNKNLRQWPRPTGWKWNIIPNMVGQSPVPALTCWTSSNNRAGRTCKWLKVFLYWMFSAHFPRAAAVQAQKPERKSPAVPANIFVPNAATAAEQPRSST